MTTRPAPPGPPSMALFVDLMGEVETVPTNALRLPHPPEDITQYAGWLDLLEGVNLRTNSIVGQAS